MESPKTNEPPESGLRNLLTRKMANFIKTLARWWQNTRRWYHILQPARACLIASLLVPILFIGVDQGRDTLRLVASEGFSKHAVWLVASLWVAGLASWGWARFLLNFEYQTFDEARDASESEAEMARLILRRSCGLLPPVGMGLGFLFAADNSGCIPQCIILALISFAVAISLWFMFEPIARLHRRRIDSGPKRFRNITEVKSDTFTKRAIIFSWLVSACLFVLLTRWPVFYGRMLGSPAVILFAIAVWVSAGSIIIHIANTWRIPFITVLLLWAAFCSFFNDNHRIRTVPANPTAPHEDLVDALDHWHNAVVKDYPLTAPGQKRPLYVVAAAGGGIRAAYWTAIVLGSIEDEARKAGTSFAAHTFVMSGVSGGSLGEIEFLALLVHGPGDGGDLATNSQRVLENDFLAPDLARMAFADFFQLFLPFPVRSFDRAQGLEDAWAAPWQELLHTNVLDETVDELYANANRAGLILPHLLLNGTSVETGRRIITSDLAVRSRIKENGRSGSSGNFLDVIVASDELTNQSLRLSTAAHQSARFTYFSPAGRFPDGSHIVDGGYFENSGASTLMDALNTIQWRIKNKEWTDIEPRIVLIDNDPIPLKPRLPVSRFLREALSPVRALLNTRDARGDYATEQAYAYNWKATNVCQFSLYERLETEPLGPCKVPGQLPLGWTLSRSAIDEMNAQLTCPFSRATNSVMISSIVASLPRCARCGTNNALASAVEPSH